MYTVVSGKKIRETKKLLKVILGRHTLVRIILWQSLFDI